MARLRTALVLALTALATAAGCGGDDEQAEAPLDPPELTVPRTEPQPAETETGDSTTPATTDAPDTSTGEDPSTAPLSPGEGDGTGGSSDTTPDSPGADAAPPAGSPAERFERECEENPAACG